MQIDDNDQWTIRLTKIRNQRQKHEKKNLKEKNKKEKKHGKEKKKGRKKHKKKKSDKEEQKDDESETEPNINDLNKFVFMKDTKSNKKANHDQLEEEIPVEPKPASARAKKKRHPKKPTPPSLLPPMSPISRHAISHLSVNIDAPEALLHSD
eukprot:41792_1